MSEPRVSERTPERRIFAVGELIAGLSALLEDRVGRVWVAGEVSNLHRARSGHCYFTLVDADGQMRAALFRSAASRVPFELEEGLEVVAYAEVTIYAARGDLQLIVRQLEPRGQGALQLAFDQLRRRLEAEGLFDPGRKQPLPELPRRLGVVTSPTGAAIRDVLEVSGRRFPSVPIVIAPTRVQGEGAEHEIAEALDGVAQQPGVDVILLVRGGGSLEDLWAFNTEVVARAIDRCPIPVLSGVGHEVDVTIADLVADVRAPTPSAAAEQVLPDRAALRRELQGGWRRLQAAARLRLRQLGTAFERERDALKMLAPHTRLAAQRSQLTAAQRGLQRALMGATAGRRAKLIAAQQALQRSLVGATAIRRSELNAAQQSLQRALAAATADHRSRLGQLAGRLHSLSPLAVLARGYALVRRSEDGAIVRSPSEVAVGDRLTIRLAEGELLATPVDESAE